MTYLGDFLNLRWSKGEDGEGKIIILRPDGSVDMKPFPFKPYFYIKQSDIDKVKNDINKIADCEFTSGDFVTPKMEPVVKVSVPYPSDVRKIRKLLEGKIQLYEADIPFCRRVLIDLGEKIANPHDITYFDIEVDARKGFPDPEKAEQRILSISAIRNDKDYFFCDDDEKKMISEFLDWVKPSVMVSWFGYQFDIPYIANRCHRLGIPFDDFYYPHIDAALVYKIIYKRRLLPSYALSYISKYELGKEIEDYGEIGKINILYEYFVKDRAKLHKYSLDQVSVLKELDEKFALTQIRFSLAQICHCFPYNFDAHMNYFLESLILHLQRKRSPMVVYPCKSKEEEESEPYTGGLTVDPIPGIYENVAVIDFHQLYPSIIKAFNIDLTTFSEDKSQQIKAPHGSFKLEPKSVFAEAIELFDDQRSKAKEMRAKYQPGSLEYRIWDGRQFSLKVCMVSLYGILGFARGRFFNRQIAENISLIGRDLLNYAINVVRRKYKVIYCDTDSLFIQFHPNESIDDINLFIRDVEDKINDFLKRVYNCPSPDMKFKIDRIFSKLYLGSQKKRYFGYVIYEDGKATDYLLVKGWEYVRSDVPEIVKLIQERLMRMLLENASDKDIKKFLDFVKRLMFKGYLNDKMICYKGIQKELSEYRVKAPHVKAARELDRLGIKPRVGDKIKYIIGRRGEPIPVVDVKEIKLTPEDYEEFWDRFVKPVCERFNITFNRRITDWWS